MIHPGEVVAVPDTGGQRRPLLGILIGLLTAVVVAFPVFVLVVGAVASFSGCFLSCAEPEPLEGVLWTSAALVLFALPFAAGAAAAGFRSRVITGVWAAALVVGALWIFFNVAGSV
ncbi:hypothetical protein [Amycolatopsis palatopharyngis]|uniref:hypothetical protein n=1 Tax=Amycolatopsis palatopharyngis TaxID=187982 RepID=UPI000E23CFE2|nr:hypothetical protein [Amycolatopsis palatopharyngis]